MSPFPLDYLRHILDEAQYLSRCSRHISKKKFLKDETLKRSFVRSIEIIGEAVKKLPVDVRDRYPDFEWKAIAGMRDNLYTIISAWIMILSGMSLPIKFRH